MILAFVHLPTTTTARNHSKSDRLRYISDVSHNATKHWPSEERRKGSRGRTARWTSPTDSGQSRSQTTCTNSVRSTLNTTGYCNRSVKDRWRPELVNCKSLLVAWLVTRISYASQIVECRNRCSLTKIVFSVKQQCFFLNFVCNTLFIDNSKGFSWTNKLFYSKSPHS